MYLPIHLDNRMIWDRLDSCWRRTREAWTDRVRARFDERYWRHFSREARDYVDALEKFEPTLRKAQEEVARWYP